MWTNEYQPEKYAFQVLLSVYNGEDHLKRCLDSLDHALSKYNWVLVYGDDGSTDDSTIELAKNARNLTCNKIHLYEFDKARTVAIAKNRLVKEAHEFKKEYPYILFMDADDQMLPERPLLAETAERENSQYVVGCYQTIKLDGSERSQKIRKITKNLCFGPWATLFHCDFLPEDGRFFPEDRSSDTGHEDMLAWYHLKYIKNIEPTPHSSENPVHTYIEREGSVSHLEDSTMRDYRRNTFWGISHLIKDDHRNIYKNPVSREEADAAMDYYIEGKKKKDNEHPFS